jgi:hypothetical protein
MSDELFQQLSTTSNEFMSQLLDIYVCQDWGCSWVEFLEHFTEIMSENIGNWQLEDIDGEEDDLE